MRASGRLLAVVLSGLIAAQCASAGVRPLQTAAPADRSRAMLSAAEKIPTGSRVNIALANGKRFKAVLLALDQGGLVVQQRTRLPEAPLRLDPAEVVYFELDVPRAVSGKMIAIGVGIGSGVTLAILALLAAAISD